MFMHLTLVPWIAAAGELKTKPTQHSVKELRSIGIQPDILLCRSEQPLPDSERRKIALFTNVSERAVISALDLDDIYKIPMWLHAQGLDDIVVERLRLEARPGPRPTCPTGRRWWTPGAPGRRGHDGVVGKYVDHKDAYKSVAEALKHGGLRQRTKGAEVASRVRASGWGGEAALAEGRRHPGAGRIRRPRLRGQGTGLRYARETGTPYFGICYGMQAAVVDFARNVAGLEARTAPRTTATARTR
jgi:CTP synthase